MQENITVNTPVNIPQLSSELMRHPDPDYVNYLLKGFHNGFDTKVQNTLLPNKICKNLQSALKQKYIVDELIEKEISKGFLSGPYSKPPFTSYRVSPIGVAEGKYSKKKRLIVDLSAPHNKVDHPSINELINKDQCSLNYVTIDDAIKYIVQCGKGALMCKTDISDAFKLIPILPSQYHLFCVQWRERYYYYTRLAFGSRSSPKIFDQFSSAICWIAQHNYDINFILHLLDDFLTIDKPDYDADRTMALLTLIFRKLNVPLASHKTMGPTTVIEYLGIILDTEKMEARLPVDKVTRISSFLDSFLHRRSCTKRELLQLLGHLNFASRVILPGRTFVSYLLQIASSVKELYHYVYINAGCREDILMWKLFLQQWNGISMFHENCKTKAADMELYTDASSTQGFGGYFQGHWFCDQWPNEISNMEEQKLSMAWLELYPIVVAAILWGHFWHKKRIVFYCDNLGTVQIIQKGRSKIPFIMKLMRRLTWCAMKYNFCVYAEHIPGVKNVIADALSRFQINKFKQLAPMAQEIPHQCPPVSQVIWNYNNAHMSSSDKQ